MGEVMTIVMILTGLELICLIWILLKAFEVSFGWFLVLIALIVASIMGPVEGNLRLAIIAGGPILFVINHWQTVRTPVLLFLAIVVIDAVVSNQAVKTLADQNRQVAIEVGR